MPDADPRAQIIEQLLDDLRITRESLAQMAAEGSRVAERQGAKPPDSISLYGCAAILHGYYSALERFLKAASREFNSEPPEGPEWHRRLLVSAASDRPGRRPPILRAGSLEALDRYLRFRHLFRNLYVFHLEWVELQPLLARLPEVQALLDADLQGFDTFLRSLLAS